MIIVTGGAGFIGSAIVWMLNNRGISDILIADNLGTDPLKWKNLRGLQFQDICSPDQLLHRLAAPDMPSVSTVIHMGACSTTTEPDADYLLENNYRYSQRLGAWALQNNARFIYASSAAIYGDGSLGFSDDPELLPRLRPLNMYGYSKQLFDLYVIRSGWADRCVGLRFFNIFGPNEYHKGPMRSMVFKAVEQIRSTGEVALFKSTDPRFADGEQLRDFYYVKEAVELIWQIMQRPGLSGIYNVGNATTASWNQLIAAVFSALGRPPRIRYIDMPADLVGRYQNYTCADMAALEAALGHGIPPQDLTRSVYDYVAGYLSGDTPINLDFLNNTEGESIQ